MTGGLLPLVTLAWMIAEPPVALPEPPVGHSGDYEISAFYVFQIVLFVPLAYVGASLATRPGTAPIAWVFLAIAAASGVGLFSALDATHAVVLNPGSLPFGAGAAVLTRVVRVSHVLIGSLALAMLPTGWLPASRARWLVVPPLVVGGGTFAVGLFGAGPVDSFPYAENPLALPGAVGEVAGSAEAPLAWPFTVAPLAVWLLALASRERE